MRVGRKVKLLFASLLACVTFHRAHALVTQIESGIDGVACSTCGYMLQKSLKKLDFIDDVKVSLISAKALISIKENTIFTTRAFDKAILESGFSQRYLKLDLKGKVIKSNGQLLVKDNTQSARIVNASAYSSSLNTYAANSKIISLKAIVDRSNNTNQLSIIIEKIL